MLITSTDAERNMTVPWTTIRSRCCTEVSSWLPSPGRANTDSMTMAPTSTAANCSPSTVTKDSAALRSPCRSSPRSGVQPIARAVR